jgi:hypothetical protein
VKKIKVKSKINKYANVVNSVLPAGIKQYCVDQTCKNLARKQIENFNKRFNQCQKKSV